MSAQSATVNLVVDVENTGAADRAVEVATEMRALLDPAAGKAGPDVVATFAPVAVTVPAGGRHSVNASATVTRPQLWGPPPGQTPNMYVAVTTVSAGRRRAGPLRDALRHPQHRLRPRPRRAGQRPARARAGHLQTTTTWALWAPPSTRARPSASLQMLQEMGSNSLRTSHNPPAPEYLDLADRLGFMVLDEIFDCWANRKTTNDFHLIWDDWHDADLRLFLRRDRNHPSIIAWSIGPPARRFFFFFPDRLPTHC